MNNIQTSKTVIINIVTLCEKSTMDKLSIYLCIYMHIYLMISCKEISEEVLIYLLRSILVLYINRNHKKGHNIKIAKNYLKYFPFFLNKLGILHEMWQMWCVHTKACFINIKIFMQ